MLRLWGGVWFPWGFPGVSDGKEFACNVEDLGLIPGSGRSPWRREWLPTPVFLPGEFHGQGSVEGYSPRDCKVSFATEQLTHFILLREGCARASLPGRRRSDCCLIHGSSGLYVPVSPEVAESQPFSFHCLGNTEKMLKA